MEYQKVLPAADLRDYVKYFWVLEGNGSYAPKFTTIVDGSPGLIFQESAKGSFEQFDKDLPPLFLYGQSTTATEILSPAQFRSIGIYFHSHALKTVFGFDAGDMTDSCVDVTLMDRSGNNLVNQLAAQQTTAGRIAVMSDFLRKQIAGHKRVTDPDVALALSLVNANNGNVPLTFLQEKTKLSERGLERRFNKMIGLSPVQYCRIIRFQSSLNQLRAQGFEKMSDIAYENQYADQSHFIRSFKEFAGDTPARFRKKASELVENFPEIII